MLAKLMNRCDGVARSFLLVILLECAFQDAWLYEHPHWMQVLVLLAASGIGYFFVNAYAKSAPSVKFKPDSCQDYQLKHLFWLFSLGCSFGLIAGAYKYYAFAPELIQRRASTTQETFPLVFIHVSVGVLWILLGHLQMTQLSRLKKKLHRALGYLYIAAVIISALSLLLIQLKLQVRAPLQHEPFSITIYSLVAVFAGLRFIKLKQYSLHRAWMIRSLSVATLMPLDRLNWSLFYNFQTPLLSYYALMGIVFVVYELIIAGQLSIPIPKRGRIPFFAVALVLFALSFYFTMVFERSFVDIRGP